MPEEHIRAKVNHNPSCIRNLKPGCDVKSDKTDKTNPTQHQRLNAANAKHKFDDKGTTVRWRWHRYVTRAMREISRYFSAIRPQSGLYCGIVMSGLDAKHIDQAQLTHVTNTVIVTLKRDVLHDIMLSTARNTTQPWRSLRNPLHASSSRAWSLLDLRAIQHELVTRRVGLNTI